MHCGFYALEFYSEDKNNVTQFIPSKVCKVVCKDYKNKF